MPCPGPCRQGWREAQGWQAGRQGRQEGKSGPDSGESVFKGCLPCALGNREGTCRLCRRTVNLSLAATPRHVMTPAAALSPEIALQSSLSEGGAALICNICLHHALQIHVGKTCWMPRLKRRCCVWWQTALH